MLRFSFREVVWIFHKHAITGLLMISQHSITQALASKGCHRAIFMGLASFSCILMQPRDWCPMTAESCCARRWLEEWSTVRSPQEVRQLQLC